MSDVVLARKYRPRSFAQMVGQTHVVQALGNALRSGRLHHAYLFTGTRGIGKTTVSRILAKSLNCTGADGQGGVTAEPCGVCQACTEIDADRYLDYIEMDAASTGGKDDIKDLIERAAYKPGLGRYKVFMIDEAHQLSKDAFNALLKTLEEPPEYLKFVLATTDPEKMLPTVLSRCLQFNLRPMAPETVLEHLTHVLAAENVPTDAGALRLLARGARGSMRDALSLTDQAIAFGSGRLEEATVRQMLGSVDRSVVFSLIGALAAGDGKAVVDLVEQLRAAGQSAATTLEDMASVLQRMAVQQAVPDMPVDETDPDAQETARLATLLPADETQLLYSLCIHGRAELGLAPDDYTGLTMVLLRLLPFKTGAAPQASAAAEKKTLKPAEAATARAASVAAASPAVRVDAPAVAPVAQPAAAEPEDSPADDWGDDGGFAPPDAQPAGEPAFEDAGDELPLAPPLAEHPPLQPLPVRPQMPRTVQEEKQAAAPAPRAPAASEIVAVKVREGSDSQQPEPRPVLTELPAVVPGAEGDFWHAVVQDLVAREAITALVRELALQSQLVARTDGQWTLRIESESLGQSAARERLQAALAEAGHAVRLQVEIGAVSDSPARRNRIAADQRLKAAESLLLADPFVQEMIRDFGAKIVPGSIKPL